MYTQSAKRKGEGVWERLQEKLALELDLKAGYWSRDSITGRSKAEGEFGDAYRN